MQSTFNPVTQKVIVELSLDESIRLAQAIDPSNEYFNDRFSRLGVVATLLGIKQSAKEAPDEDGDPKTRNFWQSLSPVTAFDWDMAIRVGKVMEQIVNTAHNLYAINDVTNPADTAIQNVSEFVHGALRAAFAGTPVPPPEIITAPLSGRMDDRKLDNLNQALSTLGEGFQDRLQDKLSDEDEDDFDGCNCGFCAGEVPQTDDLYEKLASLIGR